MVHYSVPGQRLRKEETLMSLETVFSLCSGVALLGWIGLVVAPRWALARDIIPSVLVPLLLGSIYASLMFAFSNEAPSEGGFDTLESVKVLFGVDGLLLAGWIHGNKPIGSVCYNRQLFVPSSQRYLGACSNYDHRFFHRRLWRPKRSRHFRFNRHELC